MVLHGTPALHRIMQYRDVFIVTTLINFLQKKEGGWLYEPIHCRQVIDRLWTLA